VKKIRFTAAAPNRIDHLGSAWKFFDSGNRISLPITFLLAFQVSVLSSPAPKPQNTFSFFDRCPPVLILTPSGPQKIASNEYIFVERQGMYTKNFTPAGDEDPFISAFCTSFAPV
jgi:hypothetical protein